MRSQMHVYVYTLNDPGVSLSMVYVSDMTRKCQKISGDIIK